MIYDVLWRDYPKGRACTVGWGMKKGPAGLRRGVSYMAEGVGFFFLHIMRMSKFDMRRS